MVKAKETKPMIPLVRKKGDVVLVFETTTPMLTRFDENHGSAFHLPYCCNVYTYRKVGSTLCAARHDVGSEEVKRNPNDLRNSPDQIECEQHEKSTNGQEVMSRLSTRLIIARCRPDNHLLPSVGRASLYCKPRATS